MTDTWSAAGTEMEPVLDRASHREAMLGWMEEIAPYGIFTTDTTLKIRSWNRWMVAHSGKSAESVIGRALVEVYPDTAARRLDEHFQRALGGQIAVLSTALHKYLLPLPPVSREFGVPFMLQTVRVAPLETKTAIVGTITILEDVTQRECQTVILRRQQEHDRLLSSSLGLLLESERPLQIAADLFPRIAAPLKLEAYFNYLISPDGTELHLHAAGGIPAETRKALGTLQIGEGPCGQVALLRRPVLLSAHSAPGPQSEMLRRLGLRSYAGFPLMIGERLLGTLSFGSFDRDTILSDEIEFLTRIAQYLSIALDRALRERALQDAKLALSEHAEVLESKIAARTVRLHETIQQLESFSYTIAHDLRAPIRALKGYTEILLNDHSAALPEDGLTIVHRLQRASHRLDALTRDLLKFSKIARQDVELAPVDISEVVADVVQVTPLLSASIEIHDPLGIARAQRTLLQQCLSNLFDNALKFAPRTGDLKIVVRSERIAAKPGDARPLTDHPFHPSVVPRIVDPRDPRAPTGDSLMQKNSKPRLRVWVEDNGIGIAPHSHQKIFGIFERVSGLENVEGTGIGLAIVARSMQQMGGSCGVESTLGQGARFWLDLEPA